MHRRRRSGLPLLPLLAGSLVACGLPAPRQAPAPETSTGIRPVPSVAAPTDPAPPVQPAPAGTIARHGTLAIVAPEPGSRLTTRSLVVSGVAPSGSTVVLDGPLFLDRTVAADPWGAWAMPVTLEPGHHELVFSLAGIAGTRRGLPLEVARDAATGSATVIWPPDGATLGTGYTTLRGSAPPGARVQVAGDDPLGAVGIALGAAGATEADAAGRWTLDLDLEPGANQVVIASGGHTIRHALLRDDGAPATATVAPELAVRSLRTLTFDDPETGLLVQVVVEVENTTDGWLDLLGGAAPTAASTAASRPVELLPFPRRVAPGRTALLLGELRSSQLDDAEGRVPTAEDIVLSIDVAYTPAATPAQLGRVTTWRLATVPGDGLSVEGRFRAGSAEPHFRVAVLGYDSAGSLIAFATSALTRPGPYEACCLPLFGAGARAGLARVVGLVSGD